MEKDTHERSSKVKTERIRFLNVIYFIDSSRTHTFQLKLRTSIIIAASVAMLILWSFVSTVLLIHESRESSLKSQRIRSLLATIFTYQTRYDQVYERSYPEDGTYLVANLDEDEDDSLSEASNSTLEPDDQSLIAKADETPASSKPAISMAAKSPPKQAEVAIEQKPAQAPLTEVPAVPTPLLRFQTAQLPTQESSGVESEKDAAAPQKQETKIADESQKQAPNEQPAASRTEPPIAVEEIEHNINEGNLEFKFALRNTDSPNLAAGYVIGVAKFVDTNGIITNIASPPDITSTQHVPRGRLSKNHRFSIRYYKGKTLIFEKPEEKSGDFEEVRIIIGDTDGNRKEIVYNLRKDTVVPK